MSAHDVPGAGTSPSARPQVAGIDPRGPRFSASVTAVLLTVVLLLEDRSAALLGLGIVGALFLSGVLRGPAGSVSGIAFRHWVQPRLAPTREREDPRPPRFAQAVGLTMAVGGVGLGLLGVPHAVPVAAALALVASFLNAAFGYCLGCELYLLGRRLFTRS